MILKITRDKSLKELPRLWADSKIFEFPALFLRYTCPSKSAGNSKILESAHNRGNSFEDLSLEENAFSKNVSLFGQTIITLGLSQNKKSIKCLWSMVIPERKNLPQQIAQGFSRLKLCSKIVFLWQIVTNFECLILPVINQSLLADWKCLDPPKARPPCHPRWPIKREINAKNHHHQLLHFRGRVAFSC